MIGETIGSYRILRKIGAGGMGAVYEAEHTLLGRRAAIKVLLPRFSSDTVIVSRFFNEAKAASAIHHIGIVEIYDFGYHSDGSAYIVMAYLEGEGLGPRLRRVRKLGVDAAVGIARQVAGALAAAHAQGIVHRDLKPDNIYIIPDQETESGERIQLLDFGIAKLGGERAGNLQTQTGTILGTPAYMSPEQCRGASNVDERTDLYALGCVLFRMLCGFEPFVGELPGDIIAGHMRDPPMPPAMIEPSVSPDLDALILRLLEKNPAARPASANDVREALVAIAARRASLPRAAAEIPLPTPAHTPSPAPTPDQATAPTRVTGRRPARAWMAPLVVVCVLALVGGITAFAVTRSDSSGRDTGVAASEGSPEDAAPAPGADATPPSPTMTPASDAAPIVGPSPSLDAQPTDVEPAPKHTPKPAPKRKPKPKREPRVFTSEEYDIHVAVRAIQRRSSETRVCWDRAIEKNPEVGKIGGSMLFEWWIDPSGKVTDGRVVSTSRGTVDAAPCVLRVIEQIRFPNPTGSSVKLRLPFGFSARDK